MAETAEAPTPSSLLAACFLPGLIPSLVSPADPLCWRQKTPEKRIKKKTSLRRNNFNKGESGTESEENFNQIQGNMMEKKNKREGQMTKNHGKKERKRWLNETKDILMHGAKVVLEIELS